MGKDLQRRNLLLRKRTKLKLQARKQNPPARGLERSLEQRNHEVLDAVLAKVQAAQAPQA